ncbi:MAG: oxygen-dependent coproporphyrinogen oxidase [Bacteroidetes bacterium]|nr:MAG: oxygen-dependent coproporphyrinogen oxidase [Bacteroidota bacterium]REK00065.1 MAG: oxygen-dependent coproporphyrinogen oxidase [Bacteroidota bacterium]REK34285.1 MAG: oxygen-dependent coproporphyrinogen oxidase [Bacteroidota bacterium]REK50695.1 MAG: oxygen-dependent coproporphyrinogen oxidase [Bacteroidota bacterium]
MNRDVVVVKFMELQDSICAAMELLNDPVKFREDLWTREAGGGGRTRILENGNLIERGGVNFAKVFGKLPASLALGGNDTDNESEHDFFATGLSIVLHPVNPFVPIIHMNIRYFESDSGRKWFGGGIDLTPHYIDTEEATIFHQSLKEICHKYNSSYYPKFKKWADDYFFIPHRNETRGIGGIFFDQLEFNNDQEFQSAFDFVCDLGKSFAPIYTRIVSRKKDLKFNEKNRLWQKLRRGRYVEFNLVYDRGTRFGLESGGRAESILMSLPPEASWVYNYSPEPTSVDEIFTLSFLRKGIDWINN